MIHGLHHNAYRCRNSEETRKFYEDFLELPLVSAFEIQKTKTGRSTRVLHTFYRMLDDSFLAFFEAPGQPFEFKRQDDFDLHIALKVDRNTLHRFLDKGRQKEIETRGISNHGSIDSVYFRDPNGYVIELAAPSDHTSTTKDSVRSARKTLDLWTTSAANTNSR
ncbi:MAG: lactoylglutathione lyase [Acidiferrobacteraceae bacterium]|mgnify:CR=1 FL=1|nr:lactoylglutathione lyase [Acidiferrobacteraceae bacterium]